MVRRRSFRRYLQSPVQHRQLRQTFTAPFMLIRLLTALGVGYEAAIKLAYPFNRLVHPLPHMRAETVQLVRQAVSEHQCAYVLVNNRAEGCAPLTVQALVDQLSA